MDEDGLEVVEALRSGEGGVEVMVVVDQTSGGGHPGQGCKSRS